MSYTTELQEWIDRLHTETGMDEPDAAAFRFRLQSLSAMHWKLTSIDLAVGLSADQSSARDAVEAQLKDALAGIRGIVGPVFIYDPRGTTVGIKFESGAYNSFSGGGCFKVPVSERALNALTGDFWCKVTEPGTGVGARPDRAIGPGM